MRLFLGQFIYYVRLFSCEMLHNVHIEKSPFSVMN